MLAPHWLGSLCGPSCSSPACLHFCPANLERPLRGTKSSFQSSVKCSGPALFPECMQHTGPICHGNHLKSWRGPAVLEPLPAREPVSVAVLPATDLLCGPRHREACFLSSSQWCLPSVLGRSNEVICRLLLSQ